MSYGKVICSKCKRELYQHFKYGEKTWRHIDDSDPICDDAEAIYPPNEANV